MSILSRMLHRVQRLFDTFQSSSSSTVPDPSNLIPLTTHHVILLLKRYLHVLEPVQVLAVALESANILSQTPMASPIHIHFCALTTITLLETSDLENPSLAEKAYEGLADVKIALKRNILFPLRPDDPDSRAGNIISFIDAKPRLHLPPTLSKPPPQAVLTSKDEESASNGAPPAMNAQEQRSLQHLADLAVQKGTDGPSEEIEGANGRSGGGHGNFGTGSPVLDFRLLATVGYLNVIPGI